MYIQRGSGYGAWVGVVVGVNECIHLCVGFVECECTGKSRDEKCGHVCLGGCVC